MTNKYNSQEIIEFINKLRNVPRDNRANFIFFNKIAEKQSLSLAKINMTDLVKGDIIMHNYNKGYHNLNQHRYVYNGHRFLKCEKLLPSNLRILENNVPYDYWFDHKIQGHILDISPYREQILFNIARYPFCVKSFFNKNNVTVKIMIFGETNDIQTNDFPLTERFMHGDKLTLKF